MAPIAHDGPTEAASGPSRETIFVVVRPCFPSRAYGREEERKKEGLRPGGGKVKSRPGALLRNALRGLGNSYGYSASC